MLYSQEDSRRALRDLIGTGMYENVQVLPEQAKKDEKKVDVTVIVKERPMRTTEVGPISILVRLWHVLSLIPPSLPLLLFKV